jgi:hypothetical protein
MFLRPPSPAAVTPSASGSWVDKPCVVYGATRVNDLSVIARAGIYYHFNFGAAAPVVADY